MWHVWQQIPQIPDHERENTNDGEGAVLDADTVNKINELTYASSIIMMTLKMRNCRMDCIQV